MQGCRWPPTGWMRGAWMRPDVARQIGLLAALAALVFGIFGLWPGLDLWVSGWFFDPVAGFAPYAEGGWKVLRLAVWRLSEVVLVVSVLAVLAGLIAPWPALRASRRLWLYIVALYLLAPGLLVDSILKPLWGRARPAQVAEFGGTLAFTPPHVLSQQCTRNCSFVSGEVAGAVALAVALFALLDHFGGRITAPMRALMQAIILLLPLFVAVQRIAAGRHFLSDALLATIFVLLCAVLLKPLILRTSWR